jgi:hypothetical protein
MWWWFVATCGKRPSMLPVRGLLGGLRLSAFYSSLG